jgi:hypothetical protein
MAVDGGRRERYHLAEVNVAVLREPLDAPATADFVAALEPINQLADHSPGFIWRLQTPEGDATSIRVFDDDRIIVNLTLWESLETLWAFTYASRHLDMLRRRREWFHRMAAAHLALWWVPAGHIPRRWRAWRRCGATAPRPRRSPCASRSRLPTHQRSSPAQATTATRPPHQAAQCGGGTRDPPQRMATTSTGPYRTTASRPGSQPCHRADGSCLTGAA